MTKKSATDAPVEENAEIENATAESPVAENPAFHGARMTKQGLTLPEIWQQLHSNAREWREVPRNARFFDIRDMIDQSDRTVLREMSDVPVKEWQKVCSGAGWTALGAIALSWCSGDPELDLIAWAWNKSKTAIEPDELTLRIAGMSNPRIVPRLLTLTEVLDASQDDTVAGALMLAAAIQSIKIDGSKKKISAMPEGLKPMIEHILERDKA